MKKKAFIEKYIDPMGILEDLDAFETHIREECAKEIIGIVFKVLIYEKSSYSKKNNKDIIENAIKEIEEQFEIKSPKK